MSEEARVVKARMLLDLQRFYVTNYWEHVIDLDNNGKVTVGHGRDWAFKVQLMDTGLGVRITFLPGLLDSDFQMRESIRHANPGTYIRKIFVTAELNVMVCATDSSCYCNVLTSQYNEKPIVREAVQKLLLLAQARLLLRLGV